MLEATPIASLNEDPVNFDTGMIPWYALLPLEDCLAGATIRHPAMNAFSGGSFCLGLD